MDKGIEIYPNSNFCHGSLQMNRRNPNVFYEIGIAHSMGKLVLLLANVNHTSDVPVDFQANRLIIYNDMRELRDKLSKTLEAVHYD